MALFKPGVAISQASGRVGGTIFSHNRGGMYMRNGTKPKVVTSAEAQLQKSIVSISSRAWGALLSKERAAWKTWSYENPVTNRLGESRILSGAQCFNQINTRLLRADAPAITLPPIGGPPIAVATFSAAADASAHTILLTFSDTPVPADTAYWVWGCVVNSEAVQYYQNRLVLVAQLAAATATGADIGATWEARFGQLQENQVLKLEIQALDLLTGLVSGRRIAQCTVAA